MIEIKESYGNIQVDEGTITIAEEFKENVPILRNNNSIQDWITGQRPASLDLCYSAVLPIDKK